jgi:hypothetical protein
MVDIEELCNLYVSPISCLGGEIKGTKICKKVHYITLHVHTFTDPSSAQVGLNVELVVYS